MTNRWSRYSTSDKAASLSYRYSEPRQIECFCKTCERPGGWTVVPFHWGAFVFWQGYIHQN